MTKGKPKPTDRDILGRSLSSTQQSSAGDYLIRRFPPDLKLRAQHRALNEGLSLKGLVLLALEEYLTKPRAS